MPSPLQAVVRLVGIGYLSVCSILLGLEHIVRKEVDPNRLSLSSSTTFAPVVGLLGALGLHALADTTALTTPLLSYWAGVWQLCWCIGLLLLVALVLSRQADTEPRVFTLGWLALLTVGLVAFAYPSVWLQWRSSSFKLPALSSLGVFFSSVALSLALAGALARSSSIRDATTWLLADLRVLRDSVRTVHRAFCIEWALCTVLAIAFYFQSLNPVHVVGAVVFTSLTAGHADLLLRY